MAQIQIVISELQSPAGAVKLAEMVGSADGSNVEAVNIQISAILPEVGAGFILLATNLVYINSTFIGYLTHWYSQLHERGARLVLAELAPNVLDVLTTVGLAELLTICPTAAEAKHLLSAYAAEATTRPTAFVLD